MFESRRWAVDESASSQPPASLLPCARRAIITEIGCHTVSVCRERVCCCCRRGLLRRRPSRWRRAESACALRIALASFAGCVASSIARYHRGDRDRYETAENEWLHKRNVTHSPRKQCLAAAALHCRRCCYTARVLLFPPTEFSLLWACGCGEGLALDALRAANKRRRADRGGGKIALCQSDRAPADFCEFNRVVVAARGYQSEREVNTEQGVVATIDVPQKWPPSLNLIESIKI